MICPYCGKEVDNYSLFSSQDVQLLNLNVANGANPVTSFVQIDVTYTQPMIVPGSFGPTANNAAACGGTIHTHML